MTRFLACRITSYLGSAQVPVRSGETDSVIAIDQAFGTADLPMTPGLGPDAIWKRFWRAVGDADCGARPDFASNADRRRHRADVVARTAQILTTRPRDEWLAPFATVRLPTGPINRADEVSSDTCLQERGLFYSVADAERVVPQIGLGINVDGRPGMARSAPPLPGGDTEEILAGLRGAD